MYKVVRFNPRFKEYLEYLENHIDNVISCWEDIIRPILEEYADDEFLSRVDLDQVSFQIYNHDRSKYSEAEFKGYCNYWYPFDGSTVEHDTDSIEKPEDLDYQYAWLHHIHCNPHHAQYWCTIGDDGSIQPLDMPLRYICELVADWGSFHYGDPSKESAYDWWNKNKDFFIMTDDTITWIDYILDLCGGEV